MAELQLVTRFPEAVIVKVRFKHKPWLNGPTNEDGPKNEHNSINKDNPKMNSNIKGTSKMNMTLEIKMEMMSFFLGEISLHRVIIYIYGICCFTLLFLDNILFQDSGF